MHVSSIPGLPKDIPNNPKTIDNLAVHRASNLREGPHPIPQQGVLIINIITNIIFILTSPPRANLWTRFPTLSSTSWRSLVALAL